MDKPDTKDGRKGRLDDQTRGYYRRVEETLSNGFDNAEDDKELFMNNVFNTLSAEAMTVSQNQTVSRIVEELLKHASLNQLVKFSSALARDWELACTDRFVSHVTQTLVTQLGVHLGSGEESDDVFDMLLELYSYLTSDLAAHMRDTYSSHILRVMLETLGGVRVSENVTRSRIARQNTDRRDNKDSPPVLKPVPRLRGLLSDLCDKMTSLLDITDHIQDQLSNPVIQTLLLVLQATDPPKCETVCQSLIHATNMFKPGTKKNNQSSLSSVMQHDIGSHLVEQLVQVCTEDVLDDIINSQLSEQLLQMALHPTANFILQKLIKASSTQQQFETIYSALCDHIESVLCMNHNQVIVCLAEGCVRHSTKQLKFLKDLMKAFHCYEPEERQVKCVTLFAALTTYDIFYKIPEIDSDSDEDEDIKFPELNKVSLHGSLLLQQLMSWGNPRQIITSLLQLKHSELRYLACDPCGSHVIEAFLRSSTIGEKSRDLLYNKLKGLYTDLSCNKNGSRTMDSLFMTAPLRHKYTIAEELSKHEARIRGDRFGRILWYNYKLMNFQRNPNSWKQQQASEVKKRQLFQEVIADDKVKAKKQNTSPDDQDMDGSHLRLQDDDSGEESSKTSLTFMKSVVKSEDKIKRGKKKHNKLESDEQDDDIVEDEGGTLKKKRDKKIKSGAQDDSEFEIEAGKKKKHREEDVDSGCIDQEEGTGKKRKHKKKKSSEMNDDIDDELVSKRKKHKKAKNLDVNNDSDDDESVSKKKKHKKAKSMDMDSNIDDELVSKKKKHKRAKSSDLDNDIDDESVSKKKKHKIAKSSDGAEMCLVDDSSPSKPKKKKKKQK